jgi:general secretion pathway protein K
MTNAAARQRGFALLIVLLSLGLLALVGTQILASGRQETQVANMTRDAAMLAAAADGAVQRAIFATLDPTERHWNADGATHSVQIGKAVIAVRIDDEAAKVNPNFASLELLQALLLQVGADPNTAAVVATAIGEWREASGGPGRPSVATAKYVAAGRDYTPSGAAFASLYDLEAVLGMTPALLAQLWPHLTVLTDGDVDPATHDPVVIRALSAAGQAHGLSNGAESDVLSVTADARGPGATEFAVRVVVRTNAQAEGRRYRVLAYERLWNEGS